MKINVPTPLILVKELSWTGFFSGSSDRLTCKAFSFDIKEKRDVVIIYCIFDSPQGNL